MAADPAVIEDGKTIYIAVQTDIYSATLVLAIIDMHKPTFFQPSSSSHTSSLINPLQPA